MVFLSKDTEERIAVATAAAVARVQNSKWPNVASLPMKQFALIIVAGSVLLFQVFHFICQLMGKAMGFAEMGVFAGMIGAILTVIKFWNDTERRTDWTYTKLKGEADALVAWHTATPPPEQPSPNIIMPAAGASVSVNQPAKPDK